MVYETYFYDLLAVSPNATLDEIGKAYKKLALKYHPDKTNHNVELTEKFKEATRAYEVLKEVQTRRVYDAYGMDGLDGTAAANAEREAQERHAQNQQRRNGGAPRFPFQNDLFAQMFSDMNSVFTNSPFGNHFGFFDGPPMAGAAGSNVNMGFNVNMSMGPKGKRVVQPAPADPLSSRPRRGADIQHTFKVSLADMYYGRLAKFQLPRRSKCKRCDGTGSLNPKTCSQCKGLGRVMITMNDRFTSVQEIRPCHPCHGTGTYTSAADRCRDCDGGYKMEKTILNVQILPGLKDGDRCILQGMADEGKNIVPGDVVIQLQEIPHPNLVRRNDDLYLEHDIDLKTALLGGSVVVHDFINPGDDLKILVNVHGDDTLNDEVDTDIKKGEVVGCINLKEPKIVKGMGMPINSSIKQGTYFQDGSMNTDHATTKRGDLYIRFNVQIPSLDQFASLEDIATLSKILPASQNQEADKPFAHEEHLSNLPGESPLPASRREQGTDDEYDYDRIDVDSQNLREEDEDEVFYMGEWSTEVDDLNKRRKFNRKQQNKGGSVPGVRC